MTTYEFNATVKTSGLENIPVPNRYRGRLHTPAALTPRWSGTYENYNLGTNSITNMHLVSTLLATLRSQGVGVIYKSHTVNGTFTLEGKEYAYEMVEHRNRVHGHGFDETGSSFPRILDRLAESLGTNRSGVQHGTYRVTVETRAGRLPTAPAGGQPANNSGPSNTGGGGNNSDSDSDAGPGGLFGDDSDSDSSGPGMGGLFD